jgi:hypothetical protein
VSISASSRSCSGTRKLDNTAFYTTVATRTERTVTSPLDKLGMFRAGEIAPTG